MKPEPTIPEKVAAIDTLAELEGFKFGLEFAGLLDVAALHLIAVRRVEIQKEHQRRR